MMHPPLAFRMLLEKYFNGTKLQKRCALSRLVKVISQESEAAGIFVDVLKGYKVGKASEILLRIVQKLDVETRRINCDQKEYRNVMLNTIRFYQSGSSLIKELRTNRKPDGEPVHPTKCGTFPQSDQRLWSRNRIREELIHIYRKNRCIRKATAESLLISNEDLSLKIFPRYRIDENAVKKHRIQEAILHNDGKINESAQDLGMCAQTLQRKIQRHGIKKPGKSLKSHSRPRFVDYLPAVESL